MIRTATIEDVPAIQVIRRSVKENILSDPNKITDQMCVDFITNRGKGWVAIDNMQLIGFAVVDLVDNNVWALFLFPDFEKKGFGKNLHNTMLDWYFDQTKKRLWLSTEPGTRAEKFYEKAGWENKGLDKNYEIRFEMTHTKWKEIQNL